MTKTSRSVKGRVLTLAVVPFLLLLALGSWAFASPVGASPDDDFHLASAWCGWGEREELCEATGDEGVREVPAEVATAAHCYAYQGDVSAECQTRAAEADSDGMARTDRGNFESQYPGVYYAVAAVFASGDVATSAIAMRMLNVVLFIGMGLAAWMLLPALRRPALVWSWLITTVPLGLFIIASNNPSSWAIISAGTLWITLVGFLETSGRQRIGLGIVAAVAAVMGIGSRPDGIIFTALGAGLALLLTMRRERSYLVSALAPVVVILASIVAFFVGNPAGVATADLGGQDRELANPLALLIKNAVEVPTLWAGIFGTWDLGWLDTRVPGFVWVGALFVFAGVVFGALRTLERRRGLLLGLVFLALWLFPSYVLFQNRAAVGTEVQPRYLLPLVIIFAGLVLAPKIGTAVNFTRLQRILVAATLTLGVSLSLYYTIRRYTVGADGSNPNLDATIEWWWAAAPSPMVVWVIGTLAYAGVAAIVSGCFAKQSMGESRPAALADPAITLKP